MPPDALPQNPAAQFIVTVLSGPDAGLTRVFEQARIGLGRDRDNDFVLSDGFVSSRHGEIVMRDGEVEFRDLKSRHGSYVRVGSKFEHLHDRERDTAIRLDHGTEIQIGSTLLRVSLHTEQARLAALPLPELGRLAPRPATVPGLSVPSWSTGLPELADDDSVSERYITATHRALNDLPAGIESSDKRFAILFRLAGQLNGLTALDDILALVADVVFEAFPAATFFALTLDTDPAKPGSQAPLFVRVRDGDRGGADASRWLVSKSILRRVLESRESVLFVKDSGGVDISQSIVDAKITACLCSPLLGQRSLMGVMLVDTRGRGSLFSPRDLDFFSVLASSVAFAIERAQLSQSILEMFEGFVAASVNAIEGRDPTTAGHSERVAIYTMELAEAVNDIRAGRLGELHFQPNELVELRYAALLHDFGKIAVREDVLRKESRLPSWHLDLIAERFESIKALTQVQGLRGALDPSILADRPHGPGKCACHPMGVNLGTQLTDLDAVFARFGERVDEAAALIRRAAHAPVLGEHDMVAIRELGRRNYLDWRGQERPWLEAEEVRNLCIVRGTLNEEEWDHMRSHPGFSEDYLNRIPWSQELRRIPCIAGSHHEKLDGSGYPRGLRDAAVLPQVRILTIADIFDALTASDRPYRRAAPMDAALRVLEVEAEDNKLDRDLVDVFARRVAPRITHMVPAR